MFRLQAAPRGRGDQQARPSAVSSSYSGPNPRDLGVIGPDQGSTVGEHLPGGGQVHEALAERPDEGR
jgi:hypothetical protein